MRFQSTGWRLLTMQRVHIHGAGTYVLAREREGRGKRSGIELKLRSNGTYHCRFFDV